MLSNSLLNGNSESISWLNSFKSILFDRPGDLTHKMVPCGPLTTLQFLSRRKLHPASVLSLDGTRV